MKLSERLLAWLIPLVLAPLISVSILAYYSLSNIAKGQAQAELEEISTRLHNEIQSRVALATTAAAILAQDPLLSGFLQASPSRRDNVYGDTLLWRWESLQKLHPEYAGLQLVSTADDVLFDDSGSGNPSPFITISRLDHGITGPHIVVRNKVEIPTQLIVAQPIASSPHEAVAYYLLLKFESRFLASSINDVLSLAGFEYVVINDVQQVVSSSYTGNRIIYLRKLLGSSQISPSVMDVEGERVIAQRIPLLDQMSVVVFKSLSSLSQATGYINSLVAATALIASIVAMLVLFWVIRRYITKPIASLTGAMRQIAEGSLTAMLDTSRKDEIGELSFALWQMHEKIHDSNSRILTMAYRDELTGLPNRAAFVKVVDNAISKRGRNDTSAPLRSTESLDGIDDELPLCASDGSSSSMAVLFLDVDNFKTVNDSLGHGVGDLLLKQIAQRLAGWLLRNEIFNAEIARIGGDEFTFLLTSFDKKAEVEAFAGDVLGLFSLPFFVESRDIYLGASIGVSVYPSDGLTGSQLLKNADIAMYEAKSNGKNTFHFFHHEMHGPVNYRLLLELAMRSAIEHNHFQLYFQPKVSLARQRKMDFEALIRWNHPEHGFVSPGVFIPIAEDIGVIHAIGDWIFEQTCVQLRRWIDAGLHDVCVSVNLSPVQMNFGKPVDSIKRHMSVYGIDPRHLEIEITESGLMKNESRASSIIRELREMGLSIALDDFGTGYSSLAYLCRFPIDVLKVDRAFVTNLEHDVLSQKVLDTVLSLARSLNLKIVAEGVETSGQIQFLQARQCDYVQGYFYSKPMPATQAMGFFMDHFSAEPLPQT